MTILKTIQEHKYAVITALIIGLIFLLPHIYIYLLLSGENKEYYPITVKQIETKTFDESHYAGYVKDVSDGHIIPRTQITEWKNSSRFSSTNPLPATILGIFNSFLGIKMTIILSSFILPIILFSLFYLFAHLITKNKIMSIFISVFLFFPPNYLYIAYQNNITQKISYFSRFYAVSFNFIIFSLALILLYQTIKKEKYSLAIITGIIAGLLFYTYFYYWTFYSALIGIMITFFIIRKDKKNIKKISLILFAIIITIIPFFKNIMAYAPNKNEMLLRNGAIFTHLPYKPELTFLLCIILGYMIYKKSWKVQEGIFIMSLLITSIVTLNIQVLIGYKVLPLHYIKTAIYPIILLTGAYLYSLRPISKWRINYLILGGTIFLLFFALFWQIAYSNNMYHYYTLSKDKEQVLKWLNQNTKTDDVILTIDPEMIQLIPIYTHNNNYIPNAITDIVPLKEIIDRRLTAYHILSITINNFDFLDNPCNFVKILNQPLNEKKKTIFNESAYRLAFSTRFTFSYIFTQKCQIPEETKKAIYEKYDSFSKNKNELFSRYHFNYILITPFDKKIIQTDHLSDSKKIYENENYIIYKIES